MGEERGLDHPRRRPASGGESPIGRALPFMLSGSEANWARNQVTANKSALPPAIPPLERAVELWRVAQVRVLFDITAAQLGYAYAVSGRLPEGVILMEEPMLRTSPTLRRRGRIGGVARRLTAGRHGGVGR
jgi:hypothetical protein